MVCSSVSFSFVPLESVASICKQLTLPPKAAQNDKMGGVRGGRRITNTHQKLGESVSLKQNKTKQKQKDLQTKAILFN